LQSRVVSRARTARPLSLPRLMSPGGFSAQHDVPLLCHREGRRPRRPRGKGGGCRHGWLAVRGQRGRCPSPRLMSPGGFSAQHDVPLLCHREGRRPRRPRGKGCGCSHGRLAVRGQRGRCPSRSPANQQTPLHLSVCPVIRYVAAGTADVHRGSD